MACGTPICFFKPLLAIGAIAAIGMGGYNLATNGCPLGTCSEDSANTTLTTVSDSPIEATGCGSCPSQGRAETTQLASHDLGAPATGVCPHEMTGACESADECPAGMMEHCQTGGECPMSGDAAMTSLVAVEQGDAAGSCCEDEGECEMPAGQTAEAEAQTDTGAG